MIRIRRTTTVLGSWLGLMAATPAAFGGAAERATPSAQPLVGFAQPTQRVELAAVVSGRLARLPVAEGGRVRAGEVLFELDDHVQATRTAAARAAAESKLEIELAQVRVTQANKELARVTELAQAGRASPKELDDAQAMAAAMQIEWQIAEETQLQQERDFALQAALLAQLRVAAPFDGYVSEWKQRVGEAVKELDPVLVFANLDQLEVVLDCPVERIAGLRIGQTVTVTPAVGAYAPRTGAIEFINAVADAASQTSRIRIVVDNRDGAWLAGVKVAVELSDVSEPAVAAARLGAE